MTASITDLPGELIRGITRHLLRAHAFGSVAALAQCSRYLCGHSLALLYEFVGRKRMQLENDPLIWAAEHDEVGTLRALLECGAYPDPLLHSTLPHDILRKVLSAQNRGRRFSPRMDGLLLNKLLQEDLVWSQTGEGLFEPWYMATINGEIPESLPVSNRLSPAGRRDVAELIEDARFDCDFGRDNETYDHCSYSWTPLHLATKRGNVKAVEALLDHGASIESRCRGLCDCLVPTSFPPGALDNPPTWTALHVAVCSGHEELVSLLVARGANFLTVGKMGWDQPDFLVDAEDNGMTALQSAALRGNVAMCRLVLELHAAKEPDAIQDMLEHQDAHGLRALDYAVIAGHTLTTGSWLLEQGADPLQHLALHDRRFPSPLNLLCYRGNYRDALYLLDRIQCTAANATLALQISLIRLQNSTISFPPIGSLRQSVGEIMERLVSRKPRLLETDGGEELLCLVKRLLGLGASPVANFSHRWSAFRDFRAMVGRSALDLAASAGQRAVVEVLLDAVDHRPGQTSPGTSDCPGSNILLAAMTPPSWSVVYREPRTYLENVIALVERGMSFADAKPHAPGVDTRLGDWFGPLFMHDSRPGAWYNLDNYDLFERLVELVARQQGKETFPAEWAADLVYAAASYGSLVRNLLFRGSVGKFCKWLVQRYPVAPAKVASVNPTWYSGFHPAADTSAFGDPELLEWALDFIPEMATEIARREMFEHPALNLASRGHLRAAKVLVEHGLADQVTMPRKVEPGQTPQTLLQERFTAIIFVACDHSTSDGAADLINAVLNRARSLRLCDLSTLLMRKGAPAISWVISCQRNGDFGGDLNSEVESVLRLLLRYQCPRYGVKERHHGERPWPPEDYSLPSSIHRFVYPVPVAIDLERTDILEILFKESPPPKPDDILKALAMALDANAYEPDPEIVRTILDNTPVDVTALIPRGTSLDGVGNFVTGSFSPLHYLLKTFYTAHAYCPARAHSYLLETERKPLCDCQIITRDYFLVTCIGLLVQRGASWLQQSSPTRETPLNMLEAILDADGCGHGLDTWPYHNWSTLRKHVKLDWRGADGSARVLGERFNPIEVERIGLEARWE